jgi:hypothetical protein
VLDPHDPLAATKYKALGKQGLVVGYGLPACQHVTVTVQVGAPLDAQQLSELHHGRWLRPGDGAAARAQRARVHREPRAPRGHARVRDRAERAGVRATRSLPAVALPQRRRGPRARERRVERPAAGGGPHTRRHTRRRRRAPARIERHLPMGSDTVRRMSTVSATSHSLRLLVCLNCGAPFEMAPTGGHHTCTYCRATHELSPRDERPETFAGSGVLPAKPAATEAERFALLREQMSDMHPYNFPPTHLLGLAKQATNVARLAEVDSLFRAAEAKVLGGGGFDAEIELFWTTGILRTMYMTKTEFRHARAVDESALETLTDPVLRTVQRTALANRACDAGNLADAEAWLAPVPRESEVLVVHTSRTAHRGTHRAAARRLRARARAPRARGGSGAPPHGSRRHGLPLPGRRLREAGPAGGRRARARRRPRAIPVASSTRSARSRTCATCGPIWRCARRRTPPSSGARSSASWAASRPCYCLWPWSSRAS